MSISTNALKETAKPWEPMGPIASGGTVFSLAISPIAEAMRCWAATGCGVFFSDDLGQTWAQSLNGLTTPLLSALAIAPNGALFAGALGGDLFASFNFGRSWTAGMVPSERKKTVTAMLASPNFSKDGSAFAATDGGGLLVTRNSGQTWEDSSFGLGSATVLALAAPLDWSRRETMFAATNEGVYYSPNGGRAWRETELMLDDDAVDVLAVSPNFEEDHTVYAGTEAGDLYCSTDGGRAWDLWQKALGGGPLNCLWLAPDFATSGRMVAGVGAAIYLSDDRGRSWRLVQEMPTSVLALAGNASVLLAGLHDRGIWRSTDAGQTWAPSVEGLAARGFARLLAQDGMLYALGPQEGLWSSADGGRSWQGIPGLGAYLPLTTVFIRSPQELLVASQEAGLLRTTDGGKTWTVVSSVAGIQALSLAPNDGSGWAGTMDGHLLATQDGGATWQEAASPCEGQEILSLVVSPNYGQDHTVLMGTAIPGTANRDPRVALWRSTNGGGTWRQVTTQASFARWMDIALPLGVQENVAEQAILATGAYCLRPLRRAKDVWISTRIDPNGANTLGVIILGELDEGGVLFAATGTGIYRSIDGGRTWHAYMDGLEAESFISIAAAPQGETYTLYALSLGGALWKRELA